MKSSFRPYAAPVQTEVARGFAELGVPSVGTLLRKASVSTSETGIAHGLGSVPSGVFLGPPSADARVWQTKLPDDTRIYLRSSAAVTVDIWVF